jgi:hypothetical protein
MEQWRHQTGEAVNDPYYANCSYLFPILVTMLLCFIDNTKNVLSPRGVSWENGVHNIFYFYCLVSELGLCKITPGNLP